MNKKLLIFLMVIGVALIFLATGIQAGTKVEDTFKVETKEYKGRKKGLATLSHKKHAEDYGISCGECHHDKDGKPLDLKMGDDVQRCVECHTNVVTPKGKDQKKDINFLYNAMHGNCIDCHKAFNKKKGLKSKDKGAAPASCAKCHPKKKK
jgi:Class III cytochrome C family